MKSIIWIALIFCVLATEGDKAEKNKKEKKTEKEDCDEDERVPGKEVLLSNLPKEEREMYEMRLREAVNQSKRFILGKLYNLRHINETTLQKDDMGHFTLTFYTRTNKCSIKMHLIQEIDGTESVVVDKKSFSIIRPFDCELYLLRRRKDRLFKNKGANKGKDN